MLLRSPGPAFGEVLATDRAAADEGDDDDGWMALDAAELDRELEERQILANLRRFVLGCIASYDSESSPIFQ